MNSVLLPGVAFLWAVLPSAVIPATFPDGVSQMACRPRVFWVWINKDFLGTNQWQLQAFDDAQSPYIVTETIASQCGFTVTRDLDGNLDFRISFFACPVTNMDEVKFTLSVQFLVFYPAGVISYDIMMNCTLQVPWSPREMVCEENYIEVSVRRIVPSTVPVQGSWPVVLAQDWFIDFEFQNGTVLTVNATAATQMGYGVRTTSTRVVLRSPRDMPQSQRMLVQDCLLEVTISTMSYKQPWVTLLVDTTTACSVEPPHFTPTSLIWVTPAILSPLVLDMNTYRDAGPTMGVDGVMIAADAIQQRGYKLDMNDTAVGITVPIGAPGGKMKSDVQDNSYGTTYSIDLLLEQDWRGASDDFTKHTTYQPITTPFQPQPIVFMDYTLAPEDYFNVSLGNFLPDVVVSNVIINGKPLTLDQATSQGFMPTMVPIGNATNRFFMQVPFQDPLVEKTLLPGWVRRYTLTINYTMTLVSSNKTFTSMGVVIADLKDVVPPTYNGSCGKDSLIIDVTHGSMDYYWVPYIRDIPLTAELSKSQNYTVTANSSTFHLEVPVPAAGLVYEAIHLRWTLVRLDFFLKDNQTLETRSSFSVTCNFTTGRMLVCLPDGTIIATVRSSDTLPNLDARRTHLRDKSCMPVEANSSMALFNFSASSCGTTRVFDGIYMVSENEISFVREVIPVGAPSISRDSEYRLTLRCRYPPRHIKQVWGQKQPAHLLQRGSRVGKRMPGKKVARHAPNLQLRLARDRSYSEFFTEGDFPVMKLPSESLLLEVHLLHHGAQQALVLQECWATSTAEQSEALWWSLISHQCAVDGASYRIILRESPAENLKQFELKVIPSADVDGLHGLVYLHCQVSICDGSQAGKKACVQTCDPRDRTELSALYPDQVTEFVSLGPVEILAPGDLVSARYLGEEQWLTWPWLLSVGLAVLGVLAVASVFFAIRVLKC